MRNITGLIQVLVNMPDIFTTSLLLFLVGLIAGTLNVIAGGDSLLSLPVMIFLGLPPTVANGTNRVAILIQNIGASWSFHRRGLVSREWLLLAIPPAVLGAIAGTVAAVQIGENQFQRVLAVILLAAAGWQICNPVKLHPEGTAELPVASIAIALVWIALKDTGIIDDAVASSGVVEVKVMDMNWTRYSPLPVRVEGKIKCDGS